MNLQSCIFLQVHGGINSTKLLIPNLQTKHLLNLLFHDNYNGNFQLKNYLCTPVLLMILNHNLQIIMVSFKHNIVQCSKVHLHQWLQLTCNLQDPCMCVIITHERIQHVCMTSVRIQIILLGNERNTKKHNTQEIQYDVIQECCMLP